MMMSSSFLVNRLRSRKLSESAAKEGVLLFGSREKAKWNRQRANGNRERAKLNRQRDILDRQRAFSNRLLYFLNRE
jgi:hypothetical protein